jgi:glutamate-1-semialdehyde 2,1-aminomutase
VLLIFDEVITGFRVSVGGAQQYLGVVPDLAVFGKAMASGYPIAALVGRERWMHHIASGEVIHAGTMNSGNPSVAAALATIGVLEREDVPTRLFRLGGYLRDGLHRVAIEAGLPLRVQGPGPMFHAGFTPLETARDYRDTLHYDRALYARFVLAMQERGVRLIGRGLWYVSAAHTAEEIDRCIDTARGVFAEMKAQE